MVCCANVNVVSSAPTSRRTYNSPQPLHLTAQSRSSSIVSRPKSTLFCRTLFCRTFSLSLPPSGPIVPLIRLRSSSELPGAVVSRSDVQQVKEIFANQPGRPKPILDTAPPQPVRASPPTARTELAPLNEPRLARPRPSRHSSSPLPRNSTSARPRPASRRTQPFSSLFSRYPQTNQPMLAAPLPPNLDAKPGIAAQVDILDFTATTLHGS
jgi:hypothetical protein